MINNITNLNTNSLLEIKDLLEFCKTFIFKNKFTADNKETKLSLYNSSYYIRACMNPSGDISTNLPSYILLNLEGNTNQDIINLYIKNTYSHIFKNKKPGNLIVNNAQDYINYFIKGEIIDTVKNDNIFVESNTYYRKLFITYYNNIVNRYGDVEQSYTYNINILQTSYQEELERLLLYIFECRIYNHLDILYYDTEYNISSKLSTFFELYSINKTYFLKTIYTEGFEIQENYFNFCKFFVVFMTLQQYINDKMEIVFDIDLLDEYSIINFLYSYGIYFLNDLPVYYQRRVVKNIQRLLSNKGNSQVIANILDIFELPDNTVFKYYMEKKYTHTVADDIKFIGIPYNEYSYINYIDSKKETKKKPFEYFTEEDNSWRTEKEFILNPLNDITFDYIQTKYLSIESSFEIQTFSAECSYFFDTLYRSKENSDNIFTNDKILTSYSYKGFDVFDGIIGLATLAILINGADPIIFKENFLNNSRHAFFSNSDLIIHDNFIAEDIYSNNMDVGDIYYDDLGLNSNILSRLSSSFINSGLDISKYVTVNDISVKNTKNIVDDIKDNLSIRVNLQNTIIDSTNYHEYRNLMSDYKFLYEANTNRSYFTEHDSYIEYLKDNCEDLYNLIYPLTLKNDNNELIKAFGVLVNDIQTFLKSKRFVWDIPYKEIMFKYLYYMIDYFRSYTVQLDSFKIIFIFNNEFENKLFLFDEDTNNSNNTQKIADLVGGELFESQSRPLSLYDNYYKHTNTTHYRDSTNTFIIKDTLISRLKDSIKLTQDYIDNIIDDLSSTDIFIDI